jgi:hypothetical protein
MYLAPQCAHCGAPTDGTHFCTTCGAPLSSSVAETPGAPPLKAELSQGNTALPSTAQIATPVQAPVEQTAVLATHSPGPTTAVLPDAEVHAQAAPATAPWLSPAPVPRPPRKRPNVLAMLTAGALCLSVWAFVRGIEEHTLSGTVTVVDSYYSGFDPGRSCAGDNGYDDIRGGAQVVVMDGRGETLSTGRLSDGSFDGLGCVFSFALEDVTRAEFYSLTVASENRGELQYSYDELAADDWSVQLSLGDI